VQAFRAAGQTLVDAVADHLAAIGSGPAWQPLPGGLREELLDPPSGEPRARARQQREMDA